MTQLLELLEKGVSACHVVMAAEESLKKEGFTPLYMEKEWEIVLGGRYYINHHDTTLVAFTVGENYTQSDSIRLAAAHTDFPCLKIKPNPEVCLKSYGKVNVECYGGGIWNTWLDRPLSIAGRVALKSEDVFAPKMRFVDFNRPLMTIPNLAIHMNREVNKGIELNKQTDMLPIIGCIPTEQKDEKFFLELLAEELQVNKEEILDYELTVYVAEKPFFTGIKEAFISSPRLDNLTSVYALLQGISKGNRRGGINVAALFDHEEIGSRTKQGAASLLLRDILLRIVKNLGGNEKDAESAIYRSMLLSVDVAHALHPNQPGKMDITNQPALNKGFCIKEASGQSYATDCRAVAVVQQICEQENILYQKFVNRSDMPGGSTLGAIASSILPIPTVDMGVPILAMHSARELMGREDIDSLVRFLSAWYML
ncbi:MAG: M18 family aminopeptidase [Lachnospiraceae bacterium]|nr:M18 family aminopeptidase [Lachnospiraceae bacterium]